MELLKLKKKARHFFELKGVHLFIEVWKKASPKSREERTTSVRLTMLLVECISLSIGLIPPHRLELGCIHNV